MPFASWREIGADAVVFGTVERKGQDVRVQVRLFNVRTRQPVFAKEYTGTATNPRAFAHTHRRRDPPAAARRCAASPGRKLAFVVGPQSRAHRRHGPRTGEVKEIYIADYDGANQRRVTATRELNLNPAWSPDATRHRLHVAPARRPPDIFVSFIYQGLLQNPTKGPNSNVHPRVLAGRQAASPSCSNRDGNTEIYVMNRDGSNVRRLTNNPANDDRPTWSPSGTQIAFTSDRARPGSRRSTS